jgi:uncharacterized protein
MGASTVRICDTRSGEAVKQDATGVYLVHDQRRYAIRSEAILTAHGDVLQVQPLSEGRFGSLYFENYVGLAEVSGLRFRVQHSKLTDESFATMLDGVVTDVADLAFDFGSPTSLPFERDDLGASDEVRYHALAYLRHIMRRAKDRLSAQFLQIARHPHRRMEHTARWMPVARAAGVGPGGLMAVASHPERLVPLPHRSKLIETGLGRRLRQRRPLFPADVLVDDRTESFDTHENRLVLHVLCRARDIIAGFEGRRFTNPDLAADVRAMREEIDWILSFDFLGEVGPMQFVPSQSSVLQRREGYREFLGHFIRLSQSSILAEDRDRWRALLDLKDGALLYELWCFFEVKRALDGLLGPPRSASLIATEEERRKMPWSAKLVYDAGRLELSYNRSYARKSGSYSVMLRPDVVVRVRRVVGWEALILDAKLKFDGTKLDALDKDDPDANNDWNRAAKKEDLYKMHTYRDAIREAAGAFVLYPGSVPAFYPVSPDGPRWKGIGAIPLEPGKPAEDLRDLLADFAEYRESAS